MVSHQNRSQANRHAKSNPAPAEIRAARARAKHEPGQAAAVVYATLRAWQDWESGARRMHPATFELYLLKTGQLGLDAAIAAVA